jgi:peptidoglycan hydrolase-like protein with peptidoglycan-binding domain
MALQSATLSGNPRLEAVSNGAPSVKKQPPADDPDAVKAIQRALVELGHPLPVSFQSGDADGIFGNETHNAVIAFQKKAFPGQWQEWDGRVGQKTLAKMDERLPRGEEPERIIPAKVVQTMSRCVDTEPVVVAANTTQPGGLRRTVGPPTLPGRTA